MRVLDPQHDGPRVQQFLYGSFLVTDQSLRAIDDALRRFCKDEPAAGLSYVAVSLSRQPLVAETLGELLALRNEATAAISTIFMFAKGRDRSAVVSLDAFGNSRRAGITVQATAMEADDLSQLAASIETESKNSRQWFWFVRAMSDRLAGRVLEAPSVVKTAALYVMVAMLLVLVAAWVWQGFAQSHWRASAGKVLSAGEQAIAEGVPIPAETIQKLAAIRESLDRNSPQGAAYWLSLLVGGVAGRYLPRLLAYLLPRVEFAIGDGKLRHDRARAVRTFVLGSVLFTGLLLPLLRHRLFSI